MSGVLDSSFAGRSDRAVHVTQRSLAGIGEVDLYGHGQVGSDFVRLLRSQGIRPRSVATSRGVVEGSRGKALPSVVVDCTSPAYLGREAERWITRLAGFLEQGVHLVTCNKAPLALAWGRLHEAARSGGARILASATVGGGVPVLPLVGRLDRSLGVSRIEACASGTLGHVLASLAAGVDVEAAVSSAQENGFAEPDPRLDMDGTDLAAKAVILQNALSGAPVRRLDPASGPFLSIAPAAVRQIAESCGTPRAVARVKRGLVELSVADAPWAAGAPGDAVIRVQTHCGSRFLIRGPGAGPRVTAANLLSDLQQLAIEETG